MDQAEQRRRRLAQLLDLAQTYRGWTRKELARALRRDPTKLIPGSGIPKLDLVVDLAGVLDWPVGVVIGCMWNGNPAGSDGIGEAQPSADFESLDAASSQAYQQGKYTLMIDLAKQAYDVAETPQERARACNRQAGGWDGLGRYSKLRDAVQLGLQERSISPDFRRMLQVNLANAYYTLWSLTESGAVAQGLVNWFKENPAESVRDRIVHAFAHYVAGHTFRRLITQEPENATVLGFRAKEHLEISHDLHCRLSEELEIDAYSGIGNTCKGGIIEAEVELDQRDPDEALETIVDRLDAVVDVEDENAPVGPWLESYGWWCIFGCNIALRHLTDERRLQHYMAIFTNKADEIANRSDNWSMRERAFTMQYTRWQRAIDATGFEIPNVIDKEDVQLITGTMGRFPTFRETGWRILKTAKVVRNN
ncbi:MAG: hypothetical protein JSV91_14335 [Phycisphaerales bacterium]|nr:MAG: hypothetical protein JSV91_14335 [Phycisphaerales bacterium]